MPKKAQGDKHERTYLEVSRERRKKKRIEPTSHLRVREGADRN